MAKPRVYREPVVQPLDQSIKLIPLTQAQVAIVDATDYEWLSQWNWFAQWNGCTKSFYAVRQAKRIYMHNEVMKDRKFHDHKNHDTLDNRKQNLRVCDRFQNMANRRRFKNNVCGFKGVYFGDKHWKVTIYVKRKVIYLGFYKTAEAAARAYDAAALRYFGEFAHLNFPNA